MGVAMECTLHLECTWSGVGVYFYWWVIWPSPWSGILVYTYNIRSVVGVYTPVGVVTEWLWSVHSKLECTLRQGKGGLFIGDEEIYCQCKIFHHHASIWFISLVTVHPLISSTVRSDPRCARQKRKKAARGVRFKSGLGDSPFALP